MNRIPATSFAVVICTLCTLFAQTTPPPLQKGISVKLAPTSNAAPMPEADNDSALIVAVTQDGSTFFGVDQITPSALTDKLKASLANRQRNFYLKADARVSYSGVMNVLNAALSAGIGVPTLLTAQAASAEWSGNEPPKGLRVFVAAPADIDKIAPEKIGSAKVVVWVLNSAQHGLTLTVNGQPLPWGDLQSALNQLLQNHSEKMVVVRADGSVPYAQVVHVIDLSQSASAKVVLATPQP
ncbi:MAG TPA: biopolymer transporter ExbD [Candidatus Sulfotelmatobacter sp.]